MYSANFESRSRERSNTVQHSTSNNNNIATNHAQVRRNPRTPADSSELEVDEFCGCIGPTHDQQDGESRINESACRGCPAPDRWRALVAAVGEKIEKEERYNSEQRWRGR